MKHLQANNVNQVADNIYHELYGSTGDTKCEKLPVEICGAGCVTEEQPEECHDKQVYYELRLTIRKYNLIN